MIPQKQILAEFLGTAGLLIAVVGSGIMGERLSQGNMAVALLANSIATGAALYALIQTFGTTSGAHFNPVVSLVETLWGRLSVPTLLLYVVAQVLGAYVGVLITHAMFGMSLLQTAGHSRSGANQLLSEVIATFGLLMVIALSGKRNVEATPTAVALYITSAYWCTSSTSFANPAVTIARTFSDTFAGILWTAAPGFILAQLVGGLLAYEVSKRLAT